MKIDITYVDCFFRFENISKYFYSYYGAVSNQLETHVEKIESKLDYSELDAVGFEPSYYLSLVFPNGLPESDPEKINIVVTPHPINSDRRIVHYDNVYIVCARGLYPKKSRIEYELVRSDKAIVANLILIRKLLETPVLENVEPHENCLFYRGQFSGHTYHVCESCREKLGYNKGLDLVTFFQRLHSDTTDINNGIHVILIHGIGDYANWAEEMSIALKDKGFSVSIEGYDYHYAIQLILHTFLNYSGGLVKSFVDHYEQQQRPGIRSTCVIAHSNGTRVVAKAIRKSSGIKLDRIVFVGSILSTNFHWQKFTQGNRPQIHRILNECGANDIWTIFGLFLPGAGASGTLGFNSTSDAVVNRRYSGENHGSLLKVDRCMSQWVPFILDPDELTPNMDPVSRLVRVIHWPVRLITLPFHFAGNQLLKLFGKTIDS